MGQPEVCGVAIEDAQPKALGAILLTAFDAINDTNILKL